MGLRKGDFTLIIPTFKKVKSLKKGDFFGQREKECKHPGASLLEGF
jgi:hypothetical protein